MENTEQKTCQVKMNDGKPCGRPLYDGEKCVCHSEKEDKDVKLFQQELDKIFANEKANYYDLTGFYFRETSYRLMESRLSKTGYGLPQEYKKDTYFNGATFSGKADFGSTTFSGKAHFMGAKFIGEAIFIGANFAMYTTFAMSQFQMRAYFGDVRFSEGVYFGHVRFNEGVIFNDSYINGVDFSGAKFAGFTRFTKDEFCDTTAFSHATFLGETEFIGTIFKDDVSFTGCSIAEGARVLFAVGHTNQKMFLKKAFFGSCILNGKSSLVFHRVPLNTCHFVGTDVNFVDFADVTWHRKKTLLGFTTRSIVADELGLNPENFLIAQIYRRLQKNYMDNLQYTEAGDFYIGEQEMMRMAKGKVGQFLSTNFLYKIISYYGESFILPLFWLVVTLLGFSLWLMCQTGYDLSWTGDFLLFKADYLDAFWRNLSFVTFNRSGISQLLTKPYQHGIVAIENIVVVVLVTFFVLALRRQYKRKTF